MEFNVISREISDVLRKFKRLLIYVKGSPDPDAIASSYGLLVICGMLGVEAEIYSPMQASLPQNRTMINKLSIPVNFATPDISRFDAYAVLDFQTASVDEIGDNLPCALHIDHHNRAEKDITPLYSILSEKVNSTSTILTGIIKENGRKIEATLFRNLATALYFGIQTDTNNFSFSKDIDDDMAEFLKPHMDADFIESINNTAYSEESLTIISKAILSGVKYKDWFICGVGYLPEGLRDNIAIAADYLLEIENATLVAVYAIIKKESGEIYLDVSLRTKNKKLDLNKMIKNISPTGGARKYKGAYQVSLRYFSIFKDKISLWNMANITTVEYLKRERDNLKSLQIGGFFVKMKSELFSLFDK